MTEMAVRTTTPEQLVRDFNIVSVGSDGDQSFVVVSPKQFAEPTAGVDTRELGTSSPSPFTSFVREEYNTALRGLAGLKIYDQMRKSDGTVRGTLRLIKTPVLAGRWYVEPTSATTGGKIRPIDKRAAEFVTSALGDYMSISWSQLLTEALLMCDFGYYMFEKVWEYREIEGRRRLIWKKLAPRHPMDVKEWHFDRNGGPKAVTFYGHSLEPTPFPTPGVTTANGVSPLGRDGMQQDVTIPIEKLLVFSFDKEAGNIQGISVLRSAYKHWYYKDQLYKIDAIQKERHGIGIPCIKLPLGFSPDDKLLAENMGRNLRTNERAHIVLPPMWEIEMLKLEGQPVNALESIEHHDHQIEKSILAGFLNASGNKEQDVDLFLKSTRYIADIVAQTFNDYAIPELFEKNFMRGRPPKLRVRRIGEQGDQRTMSFAIRNYVGAGIIIPDEGLEDAIREEMDLPPRDPATARKPETPQAPGQQGDDDGASAGKPGVAKAGPPRQQPKPPVGTPRSNAGTDRSGG